MPLPAAPTPLRRILRRALPVLLAAALLGAHSLPTRAALHDPVPIGPVPIGPLPGLPTRGYVTPLAPRAGVYGSLSAPCAFPSTDIAALDDLSAESWAGWIRRLSGEEAVTVGGQQVTLTTRHSAALFDGRSPAFDYLVETVQGWYPEAQIEIDPFAGVGGTWSNLILTIPGSTRKEEVVILSAHFDSMPSSGLAPGADDNATGSAALLEAARLLRGKSYPRTIRLVWFTGEEQGLYGSRAYTLDHPMTNVVGVINLDMYGYDSNSDGCFELHVGTLPQSDLVGRCVTGAIEAQGLVLEVEYLTTLYTRASDHASFWNAGVGAVEIGENFYAHAQPYTCGPADRNPAYHSSADTIDRLNLATGLAITRAALGALLSLAQAGPGRQVYLPLVRR